MWEIYCNLFKRNIHLSFLVLMGCALPKIPDLEPIPSPPKWLVANITSSWDCADFSGRFSLLPTKAVLKSNSNTWTKEKGHEWDYVMLFTSQNEHTNKPGKVQLNLEDELVVGLIEEQSILYFLSPRPDESWANEKKLFSTLGDFECVNGEVVFQDWTIRGGTEGGDVVGRTHTRFKLTKQGDLLFYQQLNGFKLTHRYFLYKKLQDEN